jgi:hypothetical protein
MDGGPTGVIDGLPTGTEEGGSATNDADATSSIPIGWVPFTEYDPSCTNLYVPGDRSKLPPPLDWENCTAGIAPAGTVCKQLKLNWGPNALLSPGSSASVAGSVVVQVELVIATAQELGRGGHGRRWR